MSLMEINWHPDARQLRLFGFGALAASFVFAVVSILVWRASPVWAVIAVTIGSGIFLSSLIAPRAARVIYLVLTIATMPIGVAVSVVLLGAFYFLLLTPLGLFFRLIGRDPLHLRFDRKEETYWVPYKTPASAERYFHQS